MDKRNINSRLQDTFYSPSKKTKVNYFAWFQKKYLLIFLFAGLIVSASFYFILHRKKPVYSLSLNLLYKTAVFSKIYATPFLVEYENSQHYFLGAGDVYGTFHMLDAVSGKKVYHFNTDGAIVAPPFSHKFSFYNEPTPIITDVKGNHYLLDAHGRYFYLPRTEYPRGPVKAKPVVINNPSGQFIVIGNSSGNVYAVGPEYGFLEWQNETSQLKGQEIVASPCAVDINGDDCDDVIFCSVPGTISAFDGRNGNEIWSIHSGFDIKASPVIAGITRSAPEVLITGMNGSCLIIDPFAGKKTASYALKSSCVATPWVHLKSIRHAIILTASADGVVYEIQFQSPDTNAQIREVYRDVQRLPFRASPLVFSLNNHAFQGVLLARSDGKITILNLVDYRIYAEFNIQGEITATPLVADINSSGLPEIIICSENGFIYCLSLTTLPPIRSKSNSSYKEFLTSSKNGNVLFKRRLPWF